MRHLVFCALLTGCALLTPGAQSPCDGLYCLTLTLAGVPGKALLCYSTEHERENARVRLASQGCAIGTTVHDGQEQPLAWCPQGVVP